MLGVRSRLLFVLSCLGLTACTTTLTGSAGALGLLALGWVLFTARQSVADAGTDAPTDAAADMGPDAAPEAVTSVCLCMAHPGAAIRARIAVPGFDPIAIQARVRAALPPDVQARLKD